jgi:hypothetical protein
VSIPPLAEVQQAAENLIHTCHKHNVTVTGFIYSGDDDNPLLMHISNLKEKGLKLLEVHYTLALMVLEKELKGQVKDYQLEPREEG